METLLPGLTLLDTKTCLASAAAGPPLPDFTLPEPSNVPEVLDETYVANIKLEGPEKQAQTLGEFKTCITCNVYLNSKVQADMHYAGKLHQKKLRQKALTESLASDNVMEVNQSEKATGSAPSNEEKPHTYLPHCSVCGITFTGAEQVQTHLIGARHAKKLRQIAQKQKLEEVKEEPVSKSAVSECFYCKYCEVVCTSQAQLDQHFQGSKHKNVIDAAEQVTSNRQTTQPASSETTTSGETTTPAIAVFACPTCNITANSEQQYLQHCSSAKHNNKLLNRPGKDKYRDHPYPNRRGTHGNANNPKNYNTNRSAWSEGKWKNSNDSFNQRSTFNSRSSMRPGRGRGRGTSRSWSRGRGTGMSSGTDRGMGWGMGQGTGQGWGLQSGNPPNSSFCNNSGTSQSQTNYSAMQGNFGGGYDGSAAGKSWGTASNTSQGGTGTKGRGWQGAGKTWSQGQEEWESTASNMVLGQYSMPNLDTFAQESAQEQIYGYHRLPGIKAKTQEPYLP